MPCDLLVVDDSTDARSLLTEELGALGYRVHGVGSGREALEHLSLHLPEAILLDILMPGLDGFETCTRIREQSEETPVIFMTGLGETEHIVKGFASGGNDYVTKPIVLAEVVARIQAHTRTASLVRTTRDAINASSAAMLAFDADGALLWINDAAAQLLPASDGSALPFHRAPASLLALRDSEERSAHFEHAGQLFEAQRISDAQDSVVVVSLQAQARRPADWRPPQLTAREGEVLLWVARGKTNRDIADILGMSPRTVNKHLEHIFEKMGVETRTAAADAARKMNLT
ncbi:MAG: DNA-binding response regulator [Rhodocyclaceae bacterium]